MARIEGSLPGPPATSFNEAQEPFDDKDSYRQEKSQGEIEHPVQLEPEAYGSVEANQQGFSQ
jgi:cation transport regulator ChaB